MCQASQNGFLIVKKGSLLLTKYCMQFLPSFSEFACGAPLPFLSLLLELKVIDYSIINKRYSILFYSILNGCLLFTLQCGYFANNAAGALKTMKKNGG
jgi:hypothetical protein